MAAASWWHTLAHVALVGWLGLISCPARSWAEAGDPQPAAPATAAKARKRTSPPMPNRTSAISAP
ncbi:MAG: hypothetical protein ACKO35_15075, partial [Planctomycetaceae bacterium]